MRELLNAVKLPKTCKSFLKISGYVPDHLTLLQLCVTSQIFFNVTTGGQVTALLLFILLSPLVKPPSLDEQLNVIS